MMMTVLRPAMKIALDCRLPIENHHNIHCVATSQTFKEYNCLHPTPSPSNHIVWLSGKQRQHLSVMTRQPNKPHRVLTCVMWKTIWADQMRECSYSPTTHCSQAINPPSVLFCLRYVHSIFHTKTMPVPYRHSIGLN